MKRIIKAALSQFMLENIKFDCELALAVMPKIGSREKTEAQVSQVL